MNDKIKYTLRKLGFLLTLAALIASPFVVQAYKSKNTTDPYILMAREVETFDTGTVDVLFVEDHPTIPKGISMVLYIEDFSEWIIRKEQENLKRLIVRVVGDYGFEGVLIVVGWDYPPENYRVQGVWLCIELRASSCTWESVPNTQITENFIQWPGIGKP